MKFNCGPTRQERRERKENWHRWFAWYPVRVGSHDCRWLEYVERQGVYLFDFSGGDWFFEYRSIK